ncbi:MAG: GLPGLI family protein [Bacteroidota bacterium]
MYGKITICFLVNCLIASWCFGQSKVSTLSGEATYELSLNLKGIELTRESHLMFSDRKVLFYYDRGEGFVMVDKYGNVGDHTMTVTTVNDNSGNAAIDGYLQDEEGNTCFFDYKRNKLTVRELVLVKPFVYKEDIPEIDWQLLKESKVIRDFRCFKAVGNFRGRTYTAWFTPKIPVSYGPWKLHGLPGLIIEASDETQEVSFKLNSISIPLDQNRKSMIRAPKNGKQISSKAAETIWIDTQRKIIYQMNSTKDREESPMGIVALNLLERFDEGQ